MDLDFLLITTVYLIIILLAHFYLKENEIKIKPVIKEVTKKPIEKPKIINDYTYYMNDEDDSLDKNVLDNYRKILENEVDITDNELIIDNGEINNINVDESNRGLLQYLDVEANDTVDSLQLLTQNLENNNEINILDNNPKSDLDKFFTSVKNKGDYSFPPVPTKDNKMEKDYRKKNLMDDIKKLNDDNIYGSVYAFDEFNASYSNL